MSTNEGDRASSAPGVLFATRKKVLSLVLWENQKETAAAVAAGMLWFFLIAWMDYASLTVICYIALFHLIARFLYRNGCRILGELNMIEKRSVPSPPNAFVTEDEMLQHLKVATDIANSGFLAAYTLAVCDCTPLVFKWMAGLFALALASKVFGTVGLSFMAFVGAFTLPKVYQLKQPEIDRLCRQANDKMVLLGGQVSEKVGDLSQQLLAKIPKIPKASDLQGTTTKPKSL